MTSKLRASNSANAFLVLLALALAAISCARVKQLVQPNKQSDNLNEFNYSIPFGYKNAEKNYLPNSISRFVILLPDQTRIHLDNIESQPIDPQTLSERIRSFAEGKSEYEKAVYIAARYDIDATALKAVLNELRKHEINTVNLLISSVERRKDSYGNEGRYEKSMGDIPAPDRVFSVDIRSSKAFGEIPGQDVKPNPLTLRVRLRSDRSLDLNNESYRDADELASKLAEVFDAREANGVFRENSNEVEKTVLFQIDHDGANSKAGHKYGDLIRVIDALKAAGSSPVVHSDSSDSWQVPVVPHRPVTLGETTPAPGKNVPSTISGGVLNGKATSLPKPPYPAAARAVRASGVVTVQVAFDEDGHVTDARAVSGHPLLRSAAEQAARSAKFAPTPLGGQRVKVTGILTYNFTYEQ